jgi:two-component system phosphate regulon response regulator PhoB
MSRSVNILMVQDEAWLSPEAAIDFRDAGYDVTTTTHGHEALALAASRTPDLMVVDQQLPDISGLDVCRTIKADPKTALATVIILGPTMNESDRVAGFEVGADDFVTKPVSVRELLLRARAILRRRDVQVPQRLGTLQAGLIALDADAHRARVDGADVQLTLLEFRLLWTLVSREGSVFPREALLSDVWGPRVKVELRTVDQHVKRLRKKLGASGKLLQTIRGVGYRFELA